MREELINRTKDCKTVDEVIELAKKSNIEITRKEAEFAFNQTHKN